MAGADALPDHAASLPVPAAWFVIMSGHGWNRLNGSRAPAVTRAAAVLDLLAQDAGSPIRLTALSRTLGLPKASVSNICDALVDVGLAQRRGGGFILGSKVVQLSAAYLSSLDLVREFHDVCDASTSARDETVQLAILGDAFDVVYMARRLGAQSVRLVSDVGRHLPANCTATGKALLAAISPAELESRLPADGRLPILTPRSIATVDALLGELAEIRERGYAIDNQEAALGALCVAAAIPGERRGEPPAAVSITTVAAADGPSRILELADCVREIADGLGKRLGGVLTPH